MWGFGGAKGGRKGRWFDMYYVGGRRGMRRVKGGIVHFRAARRVVTVTGEWRQTGGGRWLMPSRESPGTRPTGTAALALLEPASRLAPEGEPNEPTRSWGQLTHPKRGGSPAPPRRRVCPRARDAAARSLKIMPFLVGGCSCAACLACLPLLQLLHTSSFLRAFSPHRAFSPALPSSRPPPSRAPPGRESRVVRAFRW